MIYPDSAFRENGGPVTDITKAPYHAKGSGDPADADHNTKAFVAVYGEQRNAVYENRVDVEVSEPRLTPRPEPLRDFPVDQVLDVTRFGAVPDDEENDVAGIRAAMKQAAEADVPMEVRFPKGRYYLDADIETDEYAKLINDALAMARAERVILNGNGSEIIIRTPPTGFLALYACKDVIVRDFVVDWDPPPFAQGFVRGNTFDTCNVERVYRSDTSASISIKTNRLGWQPAPCRGIADILIEGNTFLNWRNQAISVGCTENAIIRNNRLLAGADAPTVTHGKPHVPIRIFNARRVSVHGNHVEDRRELIPGVVEVTDDCEAVDVRGNTFSRGR